MLLGNKLSEFELYLTELLKIYIKLYNSIVSYVRVCLVYVVTLNVLNVYVDLLPITLKIANILHLYKSKKIYTSVLNINYFRK